MPFDTPHQTRSLFREVLLVDTTGMWTNVSAAAASRAQDVVSAIAKGSYPANNPCEDTCVVDQSASVERISGVFGVFDGHGGPQVARYCERALVPYFYSTLANAANPTLGSGTAEEELDFNVQRSLLACFGRVERDIIAAARPAFEMGFGSVARVGACACVAVTTSHGTLHVANAGDCRAVLGRRPAGATTPELSPARVEAVELTKVHNACVEAEKAALRTAHPYEREDQLVRCKRAAACYTKGFLQPTRSIGDLFLKYPEFNGRPNEPYNNIAYVRSDAQRARSIKPPNLPPYIDHVPDITSYNVGTEGGSFLILASDGLWDELSPAEACEIAVEAMDGRTLAGAAEEVSVVDNDAPAVPNALSPADALIRAALERAAYKCGLSMEELKSLSFGKRRSHHDDITVVVVEFHEATK
jgi:pyruvate dehydrogenase phosphatase